MANSCVMCTPYGAWMLRLSNSTFNTSRERLFKSKTARKGKLVVQRLQAVFENTAMRERDKHVNNARK